MTQATAQILLFTGVRRDAATGQEDIAALVRAAELAGKVRRLPMGLRALPPPPALTRVGVGPGGDTGGRVLPKRYDEWLDGDGA